MPSETLESHATPQQMQCMEVWGGNHFTDTAFEMPGLRVWLYSKPQSNESTGGDVYYLSSCASGRITRLLLADVSGHGGAAAATATKLRDIMRRNINRIDQSRFVARMNESFSEVTALSGTFATAIVSTFFAPAKRLTVSIAGHPRPLIFRQANQNWEELTTANPERSGLTNLPLGVDARMQYSEFNVRLDRGDLVVIYSDGLSESCDESGKMLTTQGLRALVETISTSETDQFLSTLINQVQTFGEHNFASDDVTAILVEATATRVPLVNNLLAPVRLVRSFFAHKANPQ